VGHGGTLDPLATGVLLVMLGHATRLSSYLMAAPKSIVPRWYWAHPRRPTTQKRPRRTYGPLHVTRTDIERCLLTFIGSIRQTPPAYAAVRQGGEKLYKLARAGCQ
jgi:tRNA pseudouridine55 synthase